MPPAVPANASVRARSAALAALMSLSLALSGCATGKFGGINYPVSINWKDSSWCVPWSLKIVLRKVSQRFGPVRVHSTHRWLLENWLKGGKPRSYHLLCRAVDFSVRGDPGGVLQYLRSQKAVGGYSRYPQGFYHIDNGPRRTW